MTPKPWLAITSILALFIGVVLGLLLVPNWRTSVRIGDVASTSFDVRQNAWNWWQSDPGPLPLAELNDTLLDAPPEALLHGAQELQRLEAWGWDNQTNTMMARYMSLLLWRSHIMDTEDVITLVDQAPPDMPEDVMLEVGEVLFTHPDTTVARRGFNALMSWCGFRPVLSPMLARLPETRTEWGLHYRHLRDFGRQPLRAGTGTRSADAAIMRAMADWNDNLNEEEVLLLQSVRTVTTLDDAGQRRAAAERWLDDLASGIDPGTHADPPPGAQRRLAGALLAAHERLDPTRLEQAMVIEQDPVVRTVMRLAIDANGPAWNDEDPTEFARRALPVPEGTSLYPLYCRMLAGDLSLLEPLLVSAADGSWPARFQAVALITWLLPDWIETEPNIAAGAAEADIFFERLLAHWRLEHRWVVNSWNSADDVPHD